jgi:hypothetical protein
MELSDAERDPLPPLNRKASSRHGLDWLDRRQPIVQSLHRQLQIVAGLHPQPEPLAQPEKAAEARKLALIAYSPRGRWRAAVALSDPWLSRE